MKNEAFDHKIKKVILDETDEIDTHDELLKERIWKNIMKDVGEEQTKKNRKKKFGIAFASIAVLVIGLLIITTNTTTIPVVMQSLKETFVEKKPEVINIEGQDEEINTALEENDALNYVIYIDEDRYQMVEEDGVDRIIMLEEIEGDFPEVAMEISRVDNTTTEEIAETIRETILAEDNMGIRREEQVTEPIDALMIQGMGLDSSGESDAFESEWNTPIHRYYITETQDNQVFVIKQIYFLEAAEGHGARFHYMLESFEIVEQ